MKTIETSTRQDLTSRQAEVYEFIRQEITQQRVSPAFREIGDQIGIRSSQGVLTHVSALVRKGWIKRDLYLSRGITLVPEPVTQLADLSPGQAVNIGEIYIGCVRVDPESREVTLEIIAPDTMGEVTRD